MVKVIIIGFKKPENIIKFNEILRFFDGIDALVENLYDKLQKGLGGCLENANKIMRKPMYLKIKEE